MSSLINYNGSVYTEKTLPLKALNRSFFYGDSIFETLRVCAGKVKFFEYHNQRLQKALSLFNLSLEIDLAKEINKLLNQENHNESRLRLTVFRDTEGKYTPKSNTASFLLQSEKITGQGYILNKKGLKIDLYTQHKKPVLDLLSVKSANSMIYIQAGIFAHEKGFNDVLICNTDGKICEAISSNIFIVKNKKLLTPSLNQGPVDGIMRRVVIQIAVKLGYQVLETSLVLKDIISADEVFLTNAIKGITWVEFFKDTQFSNVVVKTLHKELVLI